jgi:hypothetical protein
VTTPPPRTQSSSDAAGGRVCAYTALIGGYEELTEQPVARRSHIDFVCLTDDPTLESETWTVRLVEPLLPEDPVRSQRALKIRTHEVLPEYDISLYLDNSVLLRKTPEEVLADLLPDDAAFAAMAHSFRETIEDEFRAVVDQRLDRAERCAEQVRHYRARDPEMLALRPLKGALLLRRHHDPQVVAAMDVWLAHVLRYSRRDQLSLRYALREAGVEPLVLELDNYESDYHRWPVSVGRVSDEAIWVEPDGVLLEPRLEALQLEVSRLRASRSWRWTRYARSLRSAVRHGRPVGGASSDSTSPEPSQAATSR